MKNKRTPNLLLIGNGFDLWQKLPTSLRDFQDFYEQTKDFIVETMQYPVMEVTDDDGNVLLTLNMFDYFYWMLQDKNKRNYKVDKATQQNYFMYPKPFLDDSYWSKFEENLYSIDQETVLKHYGEDIEDIYEMVRDLQSAKDIMYDAFRLWLDMIKIKRKKTPYNLSNSFAINFNYTETLTKRFKVKKWQDFHIHGRRNTKHRSIAVGHNTDCDPDKSRKKLSFAQTILLKAINTINKHPHIHIKELNNYMNNLDIEFAQFKDIYALGLSFGKTDYQYYKYIHTECPNAKWHISYYSEKDKTNIEKVLNKLNITNYELTKGIDNVLTPFKK